MNNNKIGLVLYEPDIAQNTGSLIRLCACTGSALHIVEPCGFPLDNTRMRRAALDYHDLARITRHASWDAFLASPARASGRLILLTTKAQDAYIHFDFAPTDLLLLGRETAGVPDAVARICDARVRIPLVPPARSLNLALAAAMALGEALRQTEGFAHAA